MLGFAFFMIMLGITVLGLGSLVFFLFSNVLVLQLTVSALLFLVYGIVLERIFTHIYDGLKLSYTTPKGIHLWTGRIFLVFVMMVHFFVSEWLFFHLHDLWNSLALIGLLTIVFGFATKGWFDGVYKATPTQESFDTI